MLLFILNLLGMGLGPLIGGWLSDIYSSMGDASIRYALLSSLIFCAAGAYCLARASTPYARAVQSGASTTT